MASDVNLGGTIYISSKRAAEITGYTQDYIGQLARSKAIEAKRVSGLWYILEDSLKLHKEKSDAYIPVPPGKSTDSPEREVTVSFDGKDYISASRAAKVTGYSKDYISQLARSGKILSRQIGNRWHVDRQGLMDHKHEKDNLLAEVQVAAVGLQRAPETTQAASSPTESSDSTHFSYHVENVHLMPVVEDKIENDLGDRKETEENIETASRPEISESPQVYRHESDQESIYEPVSLEIDKINPIPIRIVSERKPLVESSFVFTSGDNKRSPRALSRSSRAIVVGSGLITTLVVAAIVIYIGTVMGYFNIMHTSRMSENAQNATSDEFSTTESQNRVKKILLNLFSKELLYIRLKK